MVGGGERGGANCRQEQVWGGWVNNEEEKWSCLPLGAQSRVQILFLFSVSK